MLFFLTQPLRNRRFVRFVSESLFEYLIHFLVRGLADNIVNILDGHVTSHTSGTLHQRDEYVLKRGAVGNV